MPVIPKRDVWGFNAASLAAVAAIGLFAWGACKGEASAEAEEDSGVIRSAPGTTAVCHLEGDSWVCPPAIRWTTDTARYEQCVTLAQRQSFLVDQCLGMLWARQKDPPILHLGGPQEDEKPPCLDPIVVGWSGSKIYLCEDLIFVGSHEMPEVKAVLCGGAL